jgi:uncharacterized protein YjbI with pentapeptide repeats
MGIGGHSRKSVGRAKRSVPADLVKGNLPEECGHGAMRLCPPYAGLVHPRACLPPVERGSICHSYYRWHDPVRFGAKHMDANDPTTERLKYNLGWDIVKLDWLKHPPDGFAAFCYIVMFFLLLLYLSITFIVLIAIINYFYQGKDFSEYLVPAGGLLGAPLVIWTAIATWQQIRLSRETQYVGTFSKAFEQLGEVRTGAIYALERIASESSRDHWPIVEFLANYVRANSDPPAQIAAGGGPPLYASLRAIPRPRADLQRAVWAIGRRLHSHVDMEMRRLETLKSVISDAGAEAKIQQIDESLRVNFEPANLQGMKFWHGNFSRANFKDCDLQDATFCNCDLSRAWFMKSRLVGARFLYCNLTDAAFDESDMSHSQLLGNEMKGANMHGANLMRALIVKSNIRQARNIEDDQIGSLLVPPL